jgi:hypothetical protein
MVLITDATKTQKFVTPRTSNQCFLVRLHFAAFSSAGNSSWFILQETSRVYIAENFT